MSPLQHRRGVVFACIALAGLIAGAPATAQDKSLQQLLEEVRAAEAEAAARNRARLAEFVEKVDQREQMLADAVAQRDAARARRDDLQAKYGANEETLASLEAELRQRAGDFGEVFGVVRQVAQQTHSIIDSSLTSAEQDGRSEFLDKLADSKALPSMAEIQRLWKIVLGEMVAQGATSRFDASVVMPDGSQQQRQVTRVGVFNVVSGEQFLQYTPSTDQLSMLPRQPADHWQNLAVNVATAAPGSGMVATAVDPSRGAILDLLIRKPNFLERVQQGQLIGYITIVLGALGLLLGLERLIRLTWTERRMRRQRENLEKPNSSNPLGRVLQAYQDNRDADVETLQLKLDEAIVKDVPKLERGLATIKLLAGVTPLLGLLGTVVGMIITFQVITMFGSGDPKLMAGGISQALVTTVIGLVVAVPLLLLHGTLSGLSRRLIQILEQQSSGMVAAHAERVRA